MRSALLAVTLVMMCANSAFAWSGPKATAASDKYKTHSGPNTSVSEKVNTSLGDIMLAEKYRYTKTSLTETRRQHKKINQ